MREQLTERGYVVQPRVGIAGLYVDLAVVDPGNSNRYVLGIIVDGDAYRSARSARDRNRTTEGVLRGQGWMIHHLWSLEWFKRPTEQLNRLVEAIEAARAGRGVAKDARLASTVSEIPREVGSPDPLSASVSGIEPVPPRANRPDRCGRRRRFACGSADQRSGSRSGRASCGEGQRSGSGDRAAGKIGTVEREEVTGFRLGAELTV